MLPLALALSLWGPGLRAPSLSVAPVPQLRSGFLAAEPAPLPVATERPSTLGLSAAEMGIGAGALVISETLVGFVGFAFVAATHYPGLLPGLDAVQVAGGLAFVLLVAAGIPAATVAGVWLGSRWLSDPREPELGHALIGAYLAVAASCAVGLAYAAGQSTYNWSGVAQTVPALLALAFQFAVIPIGAELGLHWDGIPLAPLEAPPPQPVVAPPENSPPVVLPPASSSLPPSAPAPRWGVSATLLSFSFG